ncbi:hypothetical protein LINGRAHAP2_LOCUS23855, partial [Linum grandiflorum]
MISSDSEYGSSIPESPTEEESSAAVEIEDLEDAYDIKDFEELEEAIELEKAAVVNMSLLLSEKMELQLQGLRQAADDEVLKVACDLFTQKKKVARLTKKAGYFWVRRYHRLGSAAIGAGCFTPHWSSLIILITDLGPP